MKTLAEHGYSPKRAFGHWQGARKRQRGSIRPMPHWKDHLIPPLARAICRGKGWDSFEISTPAGICCRTSISFLQRGNRVSCLEVSNPSMETGTLKVTDYAQDTGEFKPGTIGKVNGMNHPSITIDPTMTADDVLRYTAT